MPSPKGHKEVVATNRKAGRDFSLEDRFEAGLVLVGSEIKSVRAHKVTLNDGWVDERNGELWLVDVHIAEYAQANRFGHEAKRPRKLLLHRKEISKLISGLHEKRYTIVPTQLYLKDGRAKVEIALARGKREFEKRDAVTKREADLAIRRSLKTGKYEE